MILHGNHELMLIAIVESSRAKHSCIMYCMRYNVSIDHESATFDELHFQSHLQACIM